MSSVAVSRVATNMSKSFGAKEKSHTNVFDAILGKTMDANKPVRTQPQELGSQVATQKTNEIKKDTKPVPKTPVKTEGKAIQETQQSEPKIENEVDNENSEISEAALRTVKDALKKIAEALGLSEEALSEMMSVLNLNFMDLYSKDGLEALLNQTFGTTDEVSLLTHQDAFAAFKDIKMILENVLKDTNMDLNMLQKVLDTLGKEQETSEPEQPIVTTDTAEPVKQADVKETPTVNPEVVTQEAKQGVQNKPQVVVEDTRTPQKTTETVQPVQMQNEETTANKSNEKSSEGNENSNGKNSNNNSSLLNHFENVLSHTVTSKFEVVTANGIQEVVYQETSVKDILNQITSQIKVAFSDEATTLFLQLQPENLGKVAFSVKSEGGVMTGNFVAESTAAKEAIEQNLANLKVSLEQQGIKLDQVKVVIGNTNQFFNKSDQEKSFNQSYKSKRRRTQEDNIQSVGSILQNAHETLRKTGLEEQDSSVEFSA